MRSLFVLGLFFMSFQALSSGNQAKIITCVHEDINFCREKIVVQGKSYYLDLSQASLETRARVFNSQEEEIVVDSFQGEFSKELGYTDGPLESVEVFKASSLDIKL